MCYTQLMIVWILSFFKRLILGAFSISAQIMIMRLATLGGKFVIGLFIARYLGLEAVGLYGLITGAAAIIPSVIRMGLLNFVSREIVGKSDVDTVRTLGHYWILGGMLYLSLGSIAAFTGVVLDVGLIVSLSIVIIMFEQLCLDFFMFLNSKSCFLRANALVFFQSAAWIYLYMAVAWWNPEYRDIYSLLMAWSAGGLACVVLGMWSFRTLPWSIFVWDSSWYNASVKVSWKLWLSDLAITATPLADRYFVIGVLGLEIGGVYVLFWQLANAVSTLATNGVMQVYRPKLIEASDTGLTLKYNALFWDCARKTMISAGLMCIGLGVVAPFVIPFTQRALAMDYLPLLWVLLAGMLVRIASDLVGYRLFTARRDAAFALTGVGGLALTVLLNWIIVTTGGVYAAASVISIVYGSVLLWRSIICRHRTA